LLDLTPNRLSQAHFTARIFSSGLEEMSPN
jgi:hypothetical protein